MTPDPDPYRFLQRPILGVVLGGLIGFAGFLAFDQMDPAVLNSANYAQVGAICVWGGIITGTIIAKKERSTDA